MLLNIFCQNGNNFLKDQKKHFFEIEIFFNIINVFAVTFDQFNALLLDKTINILPTSNF